MSLLRHKRVEPQRPRLWHLAPWVLWPSHRFPFPVPFSLLLLLLLLSMLQHFNKYSFDLKAETVGVSAAAAS